MNPAFKVVAPIAALGVMLMAYIAVAGPADTRAFWLLGTVIGTLIVGAAAWIAVTTAVLAPLRSLARGIDRSPSRSVPDPIVAIRGEIESLRDELRRQTETLAHETESARRANEALRESESRYALMIRGASDGQWEWDLKSGRVEASPRWWGMLGQPPDEPAAAFDEWLNWVHADEREGVRTGLQAHIAGTTERFEHQHRLLHREGGWRWVLSRGIALRHASGAPYRVIGLDADVTRAKRVENILLSVAEGTGSTGGDDFFRNLVCHFARALGVPYAFITECADRPVTRLRTLAFWAGNTFADNFEYDLPGTPCEHVVREGRTCFHPSGVGTLYPREARFEAYLGVPIVGSDGSVIGHLAFLDSKAFGDEMLIQHVYRIFTARAAAEIERRHALQALEATRAAPPAVAA